VGCKEITASLILLVCSIGKLVRLRSDCVRFENSAASRKSGSRKRLG